jgi:hypothetical protein
MSTPVLMTAHTLDTIKNSITNPHHLDFSAKLDANVTIDPVRAGRVVHLNNVGNFEMGLPDVSRACHMPMFLWQNSNDFDVANNGTPTAAGGWVGTSPTGAMTGLVAVGAYELESTEFDSSLDSCVPGDGITATADNTTAATGGVMKAGVAYDVPLCGVVSRGVKKNCHGASCLYFWPVWLPRYKA